MTIAQAIARADAAMPNHMPHPEKLRHLSTLDGRIRCELIDLCEDAPATPFVPYEARKGLDLNAELIIQAPYDEIYVHYLAAMIAHEVGDQGRYAECNAFFAALYTHFTIDYLRRHKLAAKGKFRF